MNEWVLEQGRRLRPRPRPEGDGPEPRFDFSRWDDLPPAETVGIDVPPDPCGVCPLERLVAAVLVVLISPLLLAVALAVKISSPGGPVLFRQERVGLDRRKGAARPSPDGTAGTAGTAGADAGGAVTEGGLDRRRSPGVGRPFVMYKFRTMVPDAEKLTGPVWAMEKDPRITPLGRVMRKLRLDELPQLFNVAKGQMRLIGPRPERPHFVAQLTEQIPQYAERLKVPPGITGLAQVEKEYDSTVDHVRTKLKYDLFYVRNRSSLLDLKIAIKTVDVMLRGRGAR